MEEHEKRDKHKDPDTSDPDPAIQNLTRGEEAEAIERAGPRAPVVYASISARGMEELNRPFISLFGSGISAGLILMLSVVAEGLFKLVLPDVQGAEAISDIGYTFGFIVVITGRMQLFTEDTITPVLPLLANPTTRAFVRTGRLWTTVFTANMIGMVIAAAMLTWGDIVTQAQLDSIVEVSSKVLDHTPFETLRYGVIAGFLIAALVWCMPTSHGSEFWLIFFITYIIALGDFTHVVAGAGEGFLLLFDGQASLSWVLFGLILPAFVGNVLGGTILFAGLAYVQVMEEITEDKRGPISPTTEVPNPESDDEEKRARKDDDDEAADAKADEKG